MKKSENEFSSSRREAMKMLALGSTAGFFGLLGSPLASDAQKPNAPTIPNYKNGMQPVKIKSVKAIATAPEGSNLIVVKVETTEPGLYGLGCATLPSGQSLWLLPSIVISTIFVLEKMLTILKTCGIPAM
jgi:mannonate dehydratase